MGNFWDSVGDVAVAISKPFVKTGESAIGAATAVPALVVDLAGMPFDDKDDNFGSVLGAVAGRGGDIIDPIINTETIPGFVFNEVTQAAEWTLRNVMSEPISTVFIAAQHGDVLNGETWAKAYEIAQKQNAIESAIQTQMNIEHLVTLGLVPRGIDDPFDYEDPFQEFTIQQAPKIVSPSVENPIGVRWEDSGETSMAGWVIKANSIATSAAALWYLDPLAIAGRAYGAIRAVNTHHILGTVERSQAYSLLQAQIKSPKLFQAGAKTRIDTWLDWTEGANALSRPLNAHEILRGTRELKYVADPHVFASAIADASKIEDAALARQTKKLIVAAAVGDPAAVGALRSGLVDRAGSVADTMRNYVRESTLDLEALALDPALANNPRFIQHLDSQIVNLNSEKAINKTIDQWNNRISAIIGSEKTNTTGIAGSLDRLPGVHGSSNRALRRGQETGKGRALANFHQHLDDKAKRYYAETPSTSTLFQKGLHSVPLVVMKTAGLTASPWTKFPVAASDALRATQFTGVAHMHQWGAATQQLDSMMKLGGVASAERSTVLSKIYGATTEAERMAAIDRVENLSLKTLGTKYGVSSDYIENLMMAHAQKRGRTLGHLRGSAFAATDAPAEVADRMVALRGRNIQQAEDRATTAASRRRLSARADDTAKWTPRADQFIDETGTVVALPLLETQLANSVPLIDIHLANRVLERDQGRLARLSRAWADEAAEAVKLIRRKELGAKGLDKLIEARAASMDALIEAGQKALRIWKMSVLFRLGYPIRVIADDHMRIASSLNYGAFLMSNLKEGGRAVAYNSAPGFVKGTRRRAALDAMNEDRLVRSNIREALESEQMLAYPARKAEFSKASNSIRGSRAAITKWEAQIRASSDEAEKAALRTKIGNKKQEIAERKAAADYYLEQMGDVSPDDYTKLLAQVDDRIKGGLEGYLPDKRTLGQESVRLDEGVEIEGAFTGIGGRIARMQSGSKETFDIQARGVESQMYGQVATGAHRTINVDDPGHLDAWSDVLNNQLAQSQVGQFFLKGGSVDDFTRWIAEPEQAALRSRVPHYAHDPEDWGHRVEALVADYAPTAEIREVLTSGNRVSRKQLAKWFDDASTRPVVHGRTVADNLGTSGAPGLIGRGLDRIMKALGEAPTDHLSRHPFFNSMYKQHAKEAYNTRKVAYAQDGRKFTQDDYNQIASEARRDALADLKRTLFDISAHSQAAHVMRFVSPFFAAHQEVLQRWWRIVSDKPHVVRHFQQMFDAPRYLGLTVDEEGNPVKPGDPISTEHRILLQLPEALGGRNTDPDEGEVIHSKWSMSENSFNLVLQGGIGNPGAGPIVSVPAGYLAQKYASEPDIDRLSKLFNPYPPDSPQAALLPATIKRALAVSYGKGGPDLLGVGASEYNRQFEINIKDEMVEFKLKNDREPNRQEASDLMDRAGKQTTVDAYLKFLHNSASPAPARGGSKYTLIQQGWYQISKQGDAEGHDYQWKVDRFKDKYGEAYMPLIYGEFNNPASLEGTPAEAQAMSKHRSVLNKLHNPRLTRMVIGADAVEFAQAEGMDERTDAVRGKLRNTRINPFTSERYYNTDDPQTAVEEQMARRGWSQYSELTAALTSKAVDMGLNSYKESKELEAVRAAGVEKIRADNYAFDREWQQIDGGEYDSYLADMRTIASAPSLTGDPSRVDVGTLSAYLQIRDKVTRILAEREAAGLGGPTAKANAPVRQVFAAIVGKLMERSPAFQEYMYDPIISRDPYLRDED